jgi:glycosyltransferase involved in cell wall biosynthesis
VGNYVMELVRAYAALDVDHEFLLVVWGPSALRDLPLDHRFRLLETGVSHESHPTGDLWEEWVLPRWADEHRADVIHGPAFLLPGRRTTAAKVVTIHDLVAFSYPETIPWRYAMYMRWLIRRVLHAASRVITVSTSARDDLERTLGADRRRIDIVPQGVASRFRPCEAAERERVARRLGVPRPYVLFVGNLEPRKNLPSLLRAFRRVRREHAGPIHLVVAGKLAWKSGPLRAELAAASPDGTVHVTGYVAPEDLPGLYAGAEIFVFPSLWEGFGLPVLEAMACGVPVVASDVASLPEVAGDAAVLVDPASPDAIARAILELLSDDRRRAALVRRGRDRAREFPWRRTAIETLASCRRAVAGDGA